MTRATASTTPNYDSELDDDEWSTDDEMEIDSKDGDGMDPEDQKCGKDSEDDEEVKETRYEFQVSSELLLANPRQKTSRINPRSF